MISFTQKFYKFALNVVQILAQALEWVILMKLLQIEPQIPELERLKRAIFGIWVDIGET